VREKQPTAVYSLEEELHRAILRLRRLPTGTCIVRVRGKMAVQVRVEQENRPIVWPTLTSRFRHAVSKTNPSQSTMQGVEAEMSARRAGMEGRGAQPFTERDFWQEE
jgi:hypothetical protein